MFTMRCLTNDKSKQFSSIHVFPAREQENCSSQTPRNIFIRILVNNSLPSDCMGLHGTLRTVYGLESSLPLLVTLSPGRRAC